MLVCILGAHIFLTVKIIIVIKKLFTLTNRKSSLARLFFFTTIFIANFILVLLVTTASAGNIRDRTRPNYTHSTSVSNSQATELTLTLVQVATQNLQTWLRLAAVIDHSKYNLLASYCYKKDTINPALVQVGQRIRAFTPDSKSSIYRATVESVTSVNSNTKSTSINSHQNCILIKARMSAVSKQINKTYVIEIIVQRGLFLAIPNEAIIEEYNSQIVYLQKKPGQYLPQTITTGLKGELYTEVVSGLDDGDKIVTLGSFFINAQYKLSKSQKTGSENAHHHH